MGIGLAHETWQLPAGERMGMSSVTLTQALSPRLDAGLRAYTATGGERGGFITLGAVAQGRQALYGPLSLEGEVFVGGGAGASGLELAGGGLMLRSALGLGYELPGGTVLRAGWSRVRFPSGTINSGQPYVGLSVPFDVLSRGALRLDSGRGDAQPGTQYALDETAHHKHQMLVALRRARVDAGVQTTGGAPQTDLGLVGVEWRTFLHPNRYVVLQTEAAYQGTSAGYMDILGGGGLYTQLAPSLAVYADVMAGGGGGGALNTDSGKLLNTRAGAQWAFGRGWLLDASVSRMRAMDGGFAANTVGLRLGHQFGGIGVGDSTPPGALQLHDLRLRLASQRYSGTGPWRTSTGADVGLVGAQLDYFVTPNWYLSGQGLAAATGGAGAYMTGQLGAGGRMSLSAKTFVEAEALVGAAGGGGLSTGSGALGQMNLNLGFQLRPGLELLLSAGRAQSSSGGFKVNVLGVGVAYRLGVIGRN